MTINNLINSVERDAHDLYYFKHKYLLGEEIGRGGFGVVYSANRADDRLSVAVKYVQRKNITEWSTLDGRNVPLEIALLHTCRNLTGVIRTIDWYERQDGFFIVMERPAVFCDLFDFISDRGALEEVLARSLFKQIVETAVACKNLNVVHRDIKDENIILDITNGQIKLIDFGSGAFLRHGDYTDFEGTRVYSPPEWILYQQYDGLKATAWSLGILLYDLVAGDIPFHHDHEICSGVINWKQHISSSCRDLIQKCLALDPKKRFSLDDILEHPWMKGTVRQLGPDDLKMYKQSLKETETPNLVEQDLDRLRLSSKSVPTDADELSPPKHERNQKCSVDSHQKPTIVTPSQSEENWLKTIQSEKEFFSALELEDNQRTKNESSNLFCASTSQNVIKKKTTADKKVNDDNRDDTKEEEENKDADQNSDELEKRMEKMRTDAEKLFSNNNADMPLWWKTAISQAINDDSHNNNADLLSPSQRKAPGFYYHTNRGVGSDQNLPSSVLFEGAPTIQLEHPCISLYGEESSKQRPTYKNSSWNDPKHQSSKNVFRSSINITQPIYRKTNNTTVYPATIAGFNGMTSKLSLANLAAGRRPQHHRSTGTRINQLRQVSTAYTLPRGTKSSSIDRQDDLVSSQKNRSIIDSGFSSGSNGYTGSPPGTSFLLGSY